MMTDVHKVATVCSPMPDRGCICRALTSRERSSVTAQRLHPVMHTGWETGGSVCGRGLRALSLHYRWTSGYFCLFLKNLLTSVLGRGRGKMRQKADRD